MSLKCVCVFFFHHFFVLLYVQPQPFYVPTLEDEVETQRQQKVAELKASGKTGTAVTEESFNVWLENKRQARKAAAMKLVEAEFKKKKGGKGLSVLSGRDLYEYKADLFRDMDDDDAGDAVLVVDDVNDDDNDADTDTNDQRTPTVSRQSSSFNDDEDDDDDDEQNGTSISNHAPNGNLATVDEMAARVQSDLFLEGDVDDLDDLEDDD
jgi:DRG Family Regulatory Proteins, Tma46